MGGVIVLGQAFEDVANKNGWALPHRGRIERNQHWNKIPGVRLGEFNYKQTNFQRFFYGDKLIIVHKCRQCGQHQDWPGTGECEMDMLLLLDPNPRHSYQMFQPITHR